MKIVKCWNIIRCICDQRDVIPNKQKEVEGMLQPLFQYMAEPAEIEFEDDILLVMNAFMKKSG